MAIKRSDSVSIREVYTLVDSKTEKLNKSITDLSERVNGVERQIASKQGQDKTTAFLVPLVISIFFSILNLILIFSKN